MVVRPSQSVFDNMMSQASLLTSYDGGDTGFLNAYFAEWYKDMPPMARLPFGCNAQWFLYHCTYEKQPNYWDMAVDLHVIHYTVVHLQSHGQLSGTSRKKHKSIWGRKVWKGYARQQSLLN